MKTVLRRKDLVYPELSYNLVGCAFQVFDELGPGHAEKTYQNAMGVVLRNKGYRFQEQVYYKVKFRDEVVGRAYLDFLVEERVILELKKDVNFSKTHLEQVLNYLKLSKLKLGILINFTKEGVKFKRIVNIDQTV